MGTPDESETGGASKRTSYQASASGETGAAREPLPGGLLFLITLYLHFLSDTIVSVMGLINNPLTK